MGDQGCRASRAQVLRLDWWLYSILFEHISADVDQQGRVRREWSHHRPSQVLLNSGVHAVRPAKYPAGGDAGPGRRQGLEKKLGAFHARLGSDAQVLLNLHPPAAY